MSEISFIHLSDIHFRKTSGNSSDIDNDLRNALLMDIRLNAKKQLNNVKGILVGGDIGFAGQSQEYIIARDFLKNLTANIEIDEKNIYCVPGNHDVDQSIIKVSPSIYDAQLKIDNTNTLDDADWILEKQMLDTASPNLLFKAIDQYNDFAVSYSCNINVEKPVWIESFELSHNMKLKIIGLNSCIISNQDDHKNKNIIRKMVIGQSQIPSYEENTVLVSLCHHPVEYWKFREDIQNKLDKRFDIQLYGHKHEQIVSKNDERLVISAGATHPTRGKDWNPRYNWISFECLELGGERHICVKVYPRILSADRDSFITDSINCDSDQLYFTYNLNIDQKRKKNLCNQKTYNNINNLQEVEKSANKNIRKNIVYCFFELSFIHQLEILNKLNLLREEYNGKRHIEVIELILADAENKNCLEKFYDMIKMKYA